MTLVKTSTLTAASLVVILALGYFITKVLVKPVLITPIAQPC